MFNWSQPGMKEYLTVGGITIVAFVVWYLYNKNKTSAATTAASSTTGTGTTPATGTGATSGTAAGPSPTGLSLTQFLSTLTNQSSSATAPAATSTAPQTTSAPSIATVSGLRVTSVTATNVSLAWNAVNGTWFYVVTYSKGTSGQAGFGVGPVSVVAGTTWTSPPLLSNTTYQFNVQVSPEGGTYTQLGPPASVTATTS